MEDQPGETTAETPQPTERDRDNAAARAEIAREQQREYEECLRLAEAAFGPGWVPSHRHLLVEKDEEDRARRAGERARAAATVYTVKNAAGQQRHFSVVGGGQVVEHASYQDGFGDFSSSRIRPCRNLPPQI
jgi:hypothetical protein